MKKLSIKYPLGTTGINIPPIVFGTSYLGNLYTALSWERKLQIMQGWFDNVECPVAIDTAGKYGAGLALEVIGKGLIVIFPELFRPVEFFNPVIFFFKIGFFVKPFVFN